MALVPAAGPLDVMSSGQHQDFNTLLGLAWDGKREEVLLAVDRDRRLVQRSGREGLMLLHISCFGSHFELVRDLIERGSNVHALSEGGWNALIWALMRATTKSVPLITLLLDNGSDVNSVNNRGESVLWIAASYGLFEICILMVSRGADLRLADCTSRKSPLEVYGTQQSGEKPSEAVLEEHRAALSVAFAEGPHPSQVQRRNWERRKFFVSTMAGCGFQMLAHRRALYAAANPPLPPDAEIPPIEISNAEQKRAFLHACIFANMDLFRLIVSFL